MRRLVASSTPAFDATVAGLRRDAHIAAARVTAGRIRHVRSGVEAAYDAVLDVSGLGPWKYTGNVHLDKVRGRWLVRWTPDALYPGLGPGQRLVRSRTWRPRAAITGAGGVALVSTAESVDIGVQPSRITDRPRLDAVLQQQLAVPPAKTASALAATGVRPDHFVVIMSVPTERFDRLRPALAPVPGIVFRRTTARLTAQDGPGPHVIGQVGEITAEQLGHLGAPYVQGDVVGMTGLEAAFERQLAGRPDGDVHIVDSAGHTVRTVQTFAGAEPQPVASTIAIGTQHAADKALDGVSQPAAIVAIDATTGEVRAVASRPLDQQFDRALAGRYPPGSTFKVVTTAALLAGGMQPDSPLTCPPKLTVNGKVFTNFEGEAAGTISLRRAFAVSCNTAFVGAAAKLPGDALSKAATQFGFGASYPAPAAGGWPRPATPEKAAAAIGQARVQASPLHMATVAAAVVSGSWRPPQLISGPAPPVGTEIEGNVAALRGMMADVVRSGTGTAVSLGGSGKTGTAEFGSSTLHPPIICGPVAGWGGGVAVGVGVASRWPRPPGRGRLGGGGRAPATDTDMRRAGGRAPAAPRRGHRSRASCAGQPASYGNGGGGGGLGFVAPTSAHLRRLAAPPGLGSCHARSRAAQVAALRDMMGEVVRSGTGTAVKVPGPPVFGKTGTAEFGSSTPPSTHAWFIGYRGSLAFAVLVEGGGVGGRVAAPIAARFPAFRPLTSRADVGRFA